MGGLNPRRRLMAARRVVAGLYLAALSVQFLAAPHPVSATSGWAQFGIPTATTSFETGVTFTQPVVIDRELRRVELLLGLAGGEGETVIIVPSPSGTGAQTLSHQLDPVADGYILPNTPLTARWRLFGADDRADVDIGPEISVTVADDRFDWRIEAGELIRVHWYEGSDAFGRRALVIGEDAVREASELLRVTEADPIDFFVYADVDAFRDALGPGTRENIAGQANAEIRTLFALIPPGDIGDSWVASVIPHELMHLVFDTASSNPYHFPPKWLNEGLAVHVSQGYDALDRGAVERSAADGSLVPLDGLSEQFPTSFERFSLAYSESVSAVDYLIETYDEGALVSLIRSYADGLSDDQAFTAALGVDMTTFGEAWLDALGASTPTKFGPQPAPAGPIPSAWLADPGGSPPAAATGEPAASPGASPGSETPADSGRSMIAVLLIVLAVAGIAVVVFVRRRRSGPGPAG